MKFLIAIEQGTERTAFGVIVPDLPGCFSAGDTLEEAFSNAVEAIDGHIEILIEDGASVPAPADPAVHMADPDYAGMAWGYVDAPIERYLGPAQKINITVPAFALRRIDEYARRHGLSRSGFLVDAANRVIAAAGAPPVQG
ncbi:MAG: type II toxin-antitoxin system HicB family antitoxin [Xanthomonadaceae bacterium]|nr:type II toxin-antitoxin system HicB family antitoxin [Xanthomonadaceae bacterium]MDP2185149.1 type II toxin-antitoxin system HicB family antitoxin [Xanthomonadales bacterium]MDZ4117579.1 type II toxin-antitoxin system HicB family antitoxin [Xanthomonadaceae bacterium]